VFNSKNKLSIKKINDSFIKASKKELKNVLDTTEEKLVSIDFNHNHNSAIVDLSLTNVVGDYMGKVSAWYDNEWGFASRMCDLVEYIHII
jgi:glyceraldehyde-3-phosphate dehydrogenase/erythrose-4-phosphate dehydrogenase